MKIISFIRKNIIPLILLSPLRAITIIITPIFCKWVQAYGRLQMTNVTNILLVLFLLSSIFGLLTGTTLLQNVFLSVLILLPIVIIFTSKLAGVSEIKYERFIKVSSIIVAIIDFLGYFTYFIYETEDDFGIPYGHHFNNVHGLSLLNVLLFSYYWVTYSKTRERKHLRNALYFLISFVMCFYGTGLMILIVTFGIFYLLSISIKKIVPALILGIIGFGVIYYTNNSNLQYITTQLEHFSSNSDKVPRKILFLRTAEQRMHDENMTHFLFGFGPGSYNGRVSFLLNEEASNPFTKVLGNTMPKYHQADVFPYWNSYSYDNSLFQGGTANKPNSSLVSIFMEQGILFGLLFFGFWIRQMATLYRHRKRNYLYDFLFLAHLFMFLNVVSEQWIETSEFLFFSILSALTYSIIRQQTTNHTI